MLSYTVYNQKGGQAKSTVTRDLAAAHAERGDRVLVLDLDSQNSSVSRYMGVDAMKTDGDADDLSLHLIDKSDGDFYDIIQNFEEGVDVIPSHKRLGNLKRYLDNLEELESVSPGGDEFNRYAKLLNLLKDNEVQKEYDVLIADTGAEANEKYYSALYATRNVLIAANARQSGLESIPGTRDSVENFEDAMDINIPLRGVVVTDVDMTSQDMKDRTREIVSRYPTLTYFRHNDTFSEAESNRESVFSRLKSMDRIYDSRSRIMPKYRYIVKTIYEQSGESISDDSFDGPVWDPDEPENDEFWETIRNKGGVEA